MKLKNLALVSCFLVLSVSCGENPYMIGNLDRPVYLTDLKLFASVNDHFSGGDYAPLTGAQGNGFRSKDTRYTTAVAAGTKWISVDAVAESGAGVVFGTATQDTGTDGVIPVFREDNRFPIDLSARSLTIQVCAAKEFRETTVYTLTITVGQ